MASLFDSVNRFFGVGREERMKRMAKESKTNKGKAKKKPEAKKPAKKVDRKKQLRDATSTGLAAKLRDKSKKEMEKQGI